MPDSSTISAWYTPFSCFPLCLDKRTDNWPLVYSPVPIGCIFLCYLVVIWVGPKLMAKREPVNLKPVLIVYNFAMVCLSAYMFYEVPLHCMWEQYLPYRRRNRQLFDYYINLRGNSMWMLCLLLVTAAPKWPKKRITYYSYRRTKSSIISDDTTLVMFLMHCKSHQVNRKWFH